MNENLFIISDTGSYIRIRDISIFKLGVNMHIKQSLDVLMRSGDRVIIKSGIMYEEAEAYAKQIVRLMNYDEPPVNTLPKGILADFRRESYPFGDNPYELKSMV